MTVLTAGSLLIVGLAAMMQVSEGSYQMSGLAAWRALTDQAVWRHPGVLARLLLGDTFASADSSTSALDTATLIVWNVRVPRILVGVMVGIDLSYSGAIFQAVTRNELASPFLLGVSSGAGLAILIVMVLLPAWTPLLPIAAMLGGAGAFLIVYAVAWKGGTSPVRLVLAGVIVSAIAGSLQTAIFFLAGDLSVVQNAMAWTVGSLTGADWRQVRMIAPWTCLSAILGLAAARQLDVLMLGDGTARGLGMNVERTRFLLSALAIAAAGSAVSVAGLVGFVGLIVPHVVRALVGSLHRPLLVGCLFAGPALMVSADTAARLIANPVQVPVGIVTGLLGGTFFLYLMRRRVEIGR